MTKRRIANASRALAVLACALALLVAATMQSAQAQDDDDDAPPAQAAAGPLALTPEQRAAVGIVVARAAAAKPGERIAAFGRVLDPAALTADLGEVDAARAAERSASAEVARLQGLYKAGAGASLRNLEAAQAQVAKARADADAASARFAARWSPLASDAQKRQIADGVAAGKIALVRVEVPGRLVFGTLPASASFDIDGIVVAGRVLGPLKEAGESQGAALLVAIDRPPDGLAAGARLAATLVGGERAGFLVPRGAIVYEEGGAFVYHELAQKPGDDKTYYARKSVTLLMPSGDGWLVDGLDDDDRIVVRGNGVLWSQEGIGSMPADDDD
jgi:hypothetical protein